MQDNNFKIIEKEIEVNPDELGPKIWVKIQHDWNEKIEVEQYGRRLSSGCFLDSEGYPIDEINGHLYLRLADVFSSPELTVYINADTGSIDFKEGWTYTDENGDVQDAVENGEVDLVTIPCGDTYPG